MTTMAIVGAGRGLGAAVARRFAKEGFSIALISRTQSKVDALAADLENDGVTAQGFTADVRDPASLRRTLEQVTETMGPIEILQYSPLPQKDFMRPVLETRPEDLVGPVEFSIYGPVAAVQQVLPGMRFLPDGGTILFINGGSAVKPGRTVTGTTVAFHGQRAYIDLLHEELKDENIHVGQLIIGGAIDPEDEKKSPEAMAEHLWRIHSEREQRFQVDED
ncbi:SDR family NAD(P)-dependent oxidoreductase [Nocardioidaceae bacterium]|nr:SDR family NAD(P)-dependent oxidoreductase [Nocardioidaceae bacterium]